MEVFAVPTNIYPCVDRVAHQEHLTWYSSLPRSYLSSASPSVSLLLDIRISLSRFHVAVHRIRCNFCVTLSYLFNIKQLSSPNCSACNVLGDLAHLLLYCSRFNQERLILLQNFAAHSSEPLSIRLLTSNPFVSQATLLYQFLLSTRLMWTL